MKYGISWKSKIDGKFNGTMNFEKEDDALSLEAWAEEKITAYIQSVLDGDIKPNHSVLSYYLFHKVITLDTLKVISVYRVIESINEIDENDEKVQEKIQKLLNLSMSENENEAQVASEMAYKLLKKHSLTREEVEGQEFLSIDVKPQGKRVSTWEAHFYTNVGVTMGVYVIYNKGMVGDDFIKPHVDPYFRFLGRKKDVLNTVYLAECYLREIKTMVQKAKKENGFSTKEANGYRLGLISGVIGKLKKEGKSFFEKNEKMYDVVSIDTRLKEASELLTTSPSKRRSITVDNNAYNQGDEDSKKIIVRKATEDKNTKERLTYAQ